MRIDDVRMKQLSLAIYADHFTPGTEPGVDGENVLAPKRRGKQKLVQVLCENPDWFGISAFFRGKPDLALHGEREKPLVAVMDSERDLLGGGRIAFYEQRFQQRKRVFLGRDRPK